MKFFEQIYVHVELSANISINQTFSKFVLEKPVYKCYLKLKVSFLLVSNEKARHISRLYSVGKKGFIV